MKQIAVPEPVRLLDPSTDSPMKDLSPEGKLVDAALQTFAQYMLRHRLNGEEFSDIEGLSRLVLHLVPDLKKAVHGGFWNVEDADWERLKRACSAPPKGLAPLVAMQLLHFDRAVREAKTVDATVTAPVPAVPQPS